MNTRIDIDPELLDLVRRSDPMRDSRVHADAAAGTEAALRQLASKLDRAPMSKRRPRPALRFALLAGAVATVVFVLANVIPTEHGSTLSPAQAQTILKHIHETLAWPPHAIYEEENVTTVTPRDGATHISGWHEWLSTSPPYNSRSIQFRNGKPLWEQAFVNGRLDLYDPRTNTIYIAPDVIPFCEAGTTSPAATPTCRVPDAPQWNSALSEIQHLLRQADVTINTDATLDGKRAIELTFDRGRFSYWISPRNYRPLQIEDRFFPGSTRFPIARVLTGSAASPKLLSLQAQHPQATIDHSSTDYAAAKLRLIGFVSPPPKIVCRGSGRVRRCAPAPAKQTNGDSVLSRR